MGARPATRVAVALVAYIAWALMTWQDGCAYPPGLVLPQGGALGCGLYPWLAVRGATVLGAWVALLVLVALVYP